MPKYPLRTFRWFLEQINNIASFRLPSVNPFTILSYPAIHLSKPTYSVTICSHYLHIVEPEYTQVHWKCVGRIFKNFVYITKGIVANKHCYKIFKNKISKLPNLHKIKTQKIRTQKNQNGNRSSFRHEVGESGRSFLKRWINGMKNESVVTTKCPEMMSIASQAQNKLNIRRCQWSTKQHESIQRSLE